MLSVCAVRARGDGVLCVQVARRSTAAHVSANLLRWAAGVRLWTTHCHTVQLGMGERRNIVAWTRNHNMSRSERFVKEEKTNESHNKNGYSDYREAGGRCVHRAIAHFATQESTFASSTPTTPTKHKQAGRGHAKRDAHSQYSMQSEVKTM